MKNAKSSKERQNAGVKSRDQAEVGTCGWRGSRLVVATIIIYRDLHTPVQKRQGHQREKTDRGTTNGRARSSVGKQALAGSCWCVLEGIDDGLRAIPKQLRL